MIFIYQILYTTIIRSSIQFYFVLAYENKKKIKRAALARERKKNFSEAYDINVP
jgi:hypothetical protein